MVRPGVHEISPVSIYGEVYGGKDLRKMSVLNLVWKRRVIDGESGGDDKCGSEVCREVRRWKTKNGKNVEFIPKVRCCMLERTVCNLERWRSRWSGDGDSRRGSSTASVRRLNRDQFRKIHRLRGSKNFISEREKLVINTLHDLYRIAF